MSVIVELKPKHSSSDGREGDSKGPGFNPCLDLMFAFLHITHNNGYIAVIDNTMAYFINPFFKFQINYVYSLILNTA